MDKVKNLVRSNINLLLAVVGIIILVIVYLTGYQNLSTLNEDTENNLRDRGMYLTELKGYHENISKYREKVEESKTTIAKNISRLPCGIEEEDFLLYIMEANSKIGGKFSSIGFEDPEKISEFKTMIDGKMTDVTGFRTATQSNTNLTYEQLKAFLAYIYDENKPLTYLDSLAVTYNSDDATLSAIFNISKYFIEYEGGEYVPVKAPDVPIGKTNLFGAK